MAEDVKIFGMPAESGRWIYVITGMLMNFCLGAIYAYGILKVPLAAYFKTLGVEATATQMLYPYIVFLLVFALSMPLAGPYIEKLGPKKISIIGGILTALGWFLASMVTTPTSLSIFYGVIGGLGVGIAYGAPIAVSARWFPDKRGLAVGLTVLGFGFSAALIGPIADALTKAFAASGGILVTFRIFGVSFLILLTFLALVMKFPPAGWIPKGWKPPVPKAGAAPVKDLMRSEMVKTPTFYGLWFCYTIGTLAGLMAIGISKSVGMEVGASAGMDAVAAGALMTSLVIPFAACNGFGRPIFGSLTDKLNPKNAALVSYVLIVLASLLLYFNPTSVLIYTISFGILWGCLGGWLAIAPTACASYFGTKDYAKNYGLLFTAYGAGAVIGNLLAGQMKDIFGAYLRVFPIIAGLAILGMIVAALTLKPAAAKK